MFGLIIVPRNGASVIHMYEDPGVFGADVASWVSRIHLGQWKGELATFQGEIMPLSPEVKLSTWMRVGQTEVENSSAVPSGEVQAATINVVMHVEQPDEPEIPDAQVSVEEPGRGQADDDQDDGGPVDTEE